MDTWKNCVLSARKPVSIKFLVLGGGILGFGGGGEKRRFYFYGREDFSDNRPRKEESTFFFRKILQKNRECTKKDKQGQIRMDEPRSGSPLIWRPLTFDRVMFKRFCSHSGLLG